MDQDELMRVLRQTAGERHLTSEKRRALRSTIEQAALNEQSRSVLRARVFDLARENVRDRDVGMLLSWLEEINKLLLPPGAEGAKLLPEAHFSPGEACVRRIVELLENCRSSADVCVFTITDDRITTAIGATHQRGVAVRVITDNDKLHDPGSDIQGLARRGIPVRVDDTPYHMHHKFALYDEAVLLTGSYNWTRSAASDNEENLVITGDRRLIEPFVSEFGRLWARFAGSQLRS